MAVKPQLFKINKEKLINNVEEEIDKMLIDISNSKISFPNGITITPPRNFTLVKDEVMQRYIDVGWKVDYVNDQRDGNYLKFSY